MGKKTLYHGISVVVDIERPFGRNLEPNDWYRAAKDVQEQIERHCDGVESCSIEFNNEDVCEFCGYDWTEGDSPYNGGCCEEDAKVLEAWDEEKTAIENLG